MYHFHTDLWGNAAEVLEGPGLRVSFPVPGLRILAAASQVALPRTQGGCSGLTRPVDPLHGV